MSTTKCTCSKIQWTHFYLLQGIQSHKWYLGLKLLLIFCIIDIYKAFKSLKKELFVSLLFERRIILRSTSLGTLTDVCSAIESLLYPFKVSLLTARRHLLRQKELKLPKQVLFNVTNHLASLSVFRFANQSACSLVRLMLRDISVYKIHFIKNQVFSRTNPLAKML